MQAGDSIGVGYGADNFAAIEHLGLGSDVTVHNVSENGRTMAIGFDQAAIGLFLFIDRTVPTVLLIEQGTNDLRGGQAGKDLYSDVAMPFVAAAKAAGFYVAIGTLLPRADGIWTTAMEHERVAYNMLVRENTAGADAINDWAADKVIGDGVDPVHSDLYVDALHPSEKGQRRLSMIDVATLLPLMRKPPLPRAALTF